MDPGGNWVVATQMGWWGWGTCILNIMEIYPLNATFPPRSTEGLGKGWFNNIIPYQRKSTLKIDRYCPLMM